MGALVIERSAAAMLVVEMQNDLVHPGRIGAPGVTGPLARAVRDRRVVPRLASLLDRCRAAGVPVLYATKERHPAIPQPDFPPIYRVGGAAPILVHGTEGAEVVEGLAPREGDVVLPRYTSIDPSVGAGLWGALSRLGARTLVVAGVSTTMAVEGTVRAAANRGIRCVVVEDCCASVPEEWHRFSVGNVLPLLAWVAAASEVEAALG